MSDPRPALRSGLLPPTNEPLRIAVRRLRWFRAAFTACVEATGRETGCRFAVDQTKLTEAFVAWLRAIDRQKPADKQDRRDFFEFAAALMLRELIAVMPLRALSAPDRVPAESPAAFWPEGHACTLFCLTVFTAASDQEFHDHPALSADFGDLRHWWSFRENAGRDPAFAAGFLQLMLGHKPNWVMPDVFRQRLKQELAPPA